MKSISDYESINSVNPLSFIVGQVDGHTEEKNGNKYLVFVSTDKNKVLKKYTELWDEIKNLIEKIDNKPSKYGKDFMKIKFESDDKLPLNKLLKLCMLIIIVRSVCKEDGKYYPQVLLDECLLDL